MGATEPCVVVDVHLCWRAWLKFARRRRQKREGQAALTPPPPADEPDALRVETAGHDTPNPPVGAPPPPASPPPPIEPPPPTPTETPAVEPPPLAAPVDAIVKKRAPPRPKPPRDAQLPNALLRSPVGRGGATKLWELLKAPTKCLVIEFLALDGPRRTPPLVAVDA
jgi:hypothetical protein